MPTHVNSAMLVTGATGSGKSSLLATFAAWIWINYQRVLLYYACDGGGWPTDVQALIDAGVIRIWRMRTRGEAFETCVRASQGWWPAQIDPRTGETAPGVRLVPPVQAKFDLLCPQGHVLQTQTGAVKLPMVVPCKTCNLQIPSAQIQVVSTVTRTPGFEQVGGVAFDGISSMLSWQMADMAGRHARMELKGEDTAIGGRVQSGELMLGGNNRAHYGFVQLRGEEMVLNSLGIPGLVAPPVWTALLLETVDEGGLPVKGPKLAGKAKTDEAPQWFGDALEATVVKNKDGADVHRLCLQEYVDDSGVRHLCKNRSTPGSVPPYLEDPADPAQAFTQFSLGVFMDLKAEALTKSAGRYGALLANAPGMAEGMVTYGTATSAPASTPTPAAPAGHPVAATPSAPRPSAPRPTLRGRKASTAVVMPTEATTLGVAPAITATLPPATTATLIPPSVEADTQLVDAGAGAAAPVADPPAADLPQPLVPAPVAQAATVPPTVAAPASRPVGGPPRPAAPIAPRPVAAGGTTAPYAPPPGPRPPAPAPRVRPAPAVARPPQGGQSQS